MKVMSRRAREAITENAERQTHCWLLMRGIEQRKQQNRSLEFRIERTIQRRELSHDDSKRLVQESDRGRRDFIRRYFNRDVADPLLYDLIVNVEQLGTQGAASVILQAFRHWQATGEQAKPG